MFSGCALTIAGIKVYVTNLDSNYGMPRTNQIALLKQGIKAEIDDRGDKINAKIRKYYNDFIPLMAIMGKKEEESKTVTIRKRGNDSQDVMAVNKFISAPKEGI